MSAPATGRAVIRTNQAHLTSGAPLRENSTHAGDAEVVSIESREDLGRKLRAKPSGGVYLTTIQKFTEDLELLSERSNIICISDEAHRSQVNLEQKVKVTADGVEKHYGFAKYLHDSLPNATYVGFTGTPIDATIDVFGRVVDKYTMTESVKDGITVNLVYEGRAAKVTLDKDKLEEIEAYYQKCADEGANEYQIEESKKAIAHLDVILGDSDRLKAIAEDFVTHYEKRVSEGATVCGKAMVVVSNRKIAFELYKYIRDIRPEWFEIRANTEEILPEKEKKEILPIAKVNLVMTRAKDDEKELWDLLGTDEYKKELDRQFKKPFIILSGFLQTKLLFPSNGAFWQAPFRNSSKGSARCRWFPVRDRFPKTSPRA